MRAFRKGCAMWFAGNKPHGLHLQACRLHSASACLQDRWRDCSGMAMLCWALIFIDGCLFIQYHVAMSTDQIAVALLVVFAVWLSQARSRGWRRWACVVGLVAQPLLLYTGWKAGQWEFFVLAALLCLAWFKGVWVYWFAAREQLHGSGLGTIQITPGTK